MSKQERWQVSGNAAELYEKQKVPALFRPLAELTLNHVPLYGGDRVLDVACGTGILARLAAERVGPSGKVVGLDLNAGMIEVARAHTGQRGVPIDWQQGDVNDLPFPDASFDIAFCQQGLQFFPDKLLALREIRRVLAPAGRLSITLWSEVNPYNAALATALAKHVSEQASNQSVAPFAFRDAETIEALLVEAGYTAIKMPVIVVTRRMEPMNISLPQEIAGTPYAQAITSGDEATQDALIADVSAAMQPFRDGEGFAIPIRTYLVQGKAG